jgi:hypothetical protein
MNCTARPRRGISLVGDLDDPLRIEDRADKLSERTWKVTAVALLFRHSRKATKMASPSQSVLNAGLLLLR